MVAASLRRPALAAVAALALLAALLSAPDARAQTGRPAGPWATVNVCDTAAQPDSVGVRGSMPGTGDSADELFMRFELQYMRRRDGRWMRIGRAGDSGFVDVGHGDARTRQAGRTFAVAPPADGRPAYLLRALVTFEWRRDDVVVRRTRRVTQGLRPATPGADPPGFSAATCSIR